MARQSLDLDDPRIAKALSHPMRARILGILDERVASPNEIAEMIDERLPNVSYHVRALLDLGARHFYISNLPLARPSSTLAQILELAGVSEGRGAGR